MITLYNYELNDNTITSLNKIIDKDISSDVAFNLLKITTILQDLIVNKNKIYNKILEKYATIDENDPTKFHVKEENISKFNENMSKLDMIKHEFDMDKISQEDLDLGDKIKVSDLYNIRFMFDIDLPKVESSDTDFTDLDLD